jgi:hypothetical protein
MTTEIQSYEIEFQPGPNGACADYLLVDTNSVAVTFLSVGTGTAVNLVRIVGHASRKAINGSTFVARRAGR